MRLMLSAPRPAWVEGDPAPRSGEWDGWTPTFMMLGTGCCRKRLGIVGMGRIGTAGCAPAARFSMSIHLTTTGARVPSPGVEGGAGATWWGDLGPDAGAYGLISIKLPVYRRGTPSSALREAPALPASPMPMSCNTARGEIVDEAALAQVPRRGRAGGRRSHVYEREPLTRGRACRRLGQRVLAPHLGSATRRGGSDGRAG